MSAGRALDVVSVTKVASMLERATEDTVPLLPAATAPRASRFARDPGEFATDRTSLATGGTPAASDRTAPATAGTAPATGGTTTVASGRTATLTLIRGGQPVATVEAIELEEER